MDDKGDGNILVSVRNFGEKVKGVTTLYDFEVCPQNPSNPTDITVTVANEGKIEGAPYDGKDVLEQTTLALSGSPGGDKSWDLYIELDTDNSYCDATALTNVTRTNQVTNNVASEF